MGMKQDQIIAISTPYSGTGIEQKTVTATFHQIDSLMWVRHVDGYQVEVNIGVYLDKADAQAGVVPFTRNVFRCVIPYREDGSKPTEADIYAILMAPVRYLPKQVISHDPVVDMSQANGDPDHIGTRSFAESVAVVQEVDQASVTGYNGAEMA